MPAFCWETGHHNQQDEALYTSPLSPSRNDRPSQDALRGRHWAVPLFPERFFLFSIPFQEKAPGLGERVAFTEPILQKFILLENLSLEQSGSYKIIFVLPQKFEEASKTLVGRYQLGDLTLLSSNFNCFSSFISKMFYFVMMQPCEMGLTFFYEVVKSRSNKSCSWLCVNV